MNYSQKPSALKIAFGLLVAATAWFAVIFQWAIHTGSIANLLSYFTIQTNILVAVVTTFSSLFPNSKAGKFFSSTSVHTATAIYIFIVALVANTILVELQDLKGKAFFADKMLHLVVPALFILYYIFFTTKSRLAWKNGLIWAIFPVLYLIYSLIRGAAVHWYPYPFLNSDLLGYERVSVNILFMIAAFVVTGIVFIWINRKVNKKII